MAEIHAKDWSAQEIANAIKEGSPEDNLAILKEIGILTVTGDLSPLYFSQEGVSVAADDCEDEDPEFQTG